MLLPRYALIAVVELLAENRKLKDALRKWKGSYKSMTQAAAKYQRLFKEANAKLDAAQKVANPLPHL